MESTDRREKQAAQGMRESNREFIVPRSLGRSSLADFCVRVEKFHRRGPSLFRLAGLPNISSKRSPGSPGGGLLILTPYGGISFAGKME